LSGVVMHRRAQRSGRRKLEVARLVAGAELSTRRLNILRLGYALMGVGLAIV
jgi:hypothetical protein